MLRNTRSIQVIKCVMKPARLYSSANVAGPGDTTFMEIPVYDVEKPQELSIRKARLLYQSRKRGMLENDLLLSTFAKKYLDGFNEKQTMMYDRLINYPSNDWDLYYWIIQKQPTPKKFDNEVMNLLKEHAKNEDKVALVQPDLY